MTIRFATAQDAAAIASIYAPYVTASAVSFETEAPDEREMGARIAGGGDLYPWLVACDDHGAVAGYAYASQFRARPAYRFAVETSVYVGTDHQRQGVGAGLYAALIDLVARQGFTQAIAAITLPNDASVRLHEALGFVPAGAYRDVGFKLGAWRTVGLWQRPLAIVGVDPAEPRPIAAVRPPSVLEASG